MGEFIRDAKARDQVVLAAKYTFNLGERNANGGGNGRTNLLRAVEGSLKRRGTDHIDLFYLHAWDQITPVEEVIGQSTGRGVGDRGRQQGWRRVDPTPRRGPERRGMVSAPLDLRCTSPRRQGWPLTGSHQPMSRVASRRVHIAHRGASNSRPAR